MKSVHFAGLLACAALATPALAANVWPYVAVTPANFATLYETRPAALPQTWVTDPVGGTRQVLKVTVHNTEPAGPRDIAFKTGSVPAGPWYAMSVYLPSDWAAVQAPVTLAQFDKSPAAPLALQVKGGKLVLNLNFNHREASGIDPATLANSARELITVGDATPGKWHCMVVRTGWSSTLGTGTLQVYLNSAANKVYYTNNAYNGFAAAGLPVARVGLLPVEAMDVARREVLLDPLKAGNNSATPAEMFSQTPCQA